MRPVSDPVDLPALEEIPHAECLELLARHNLGRLALVVDGQPQVFPVNYAMCDGIVVFRTARGTKLTCAPGASVAFEIDGYDAGVGAGWSVVVAGTGVDATLANDDVSWNARGAIPRPVAPGLKLYRIAIRPSKISGRRFQMRQLGP